jgi:heme exporter protein CcmD
MDSRGDVMSINHIFSMGGYGAYVWPAYCITIFVFAMNFFATFQEKNRIKKIVKQYIAQANQSK